MNLFWLTNRFGFEEVLKKIAYLERFNNLPEGFAVHIFAERV